MSTPAGLLGEALSEASPDLMRSLLQTMINALLSADANAVVGAEYGRPSAERVAQRNGYRHCELDTRVGTIDVASPKLRTGTCSLGAGCLGDALGLGAKLSGGGPGRDAAR